MTWWGDFARCVCGMARLAGEGVTPHPSASQTPSDRGPWKIRAADFLGWFLGEGFEYHAFLGGKGRSGAPRNDAGRRLYPRRVWANMRTKKDAKAFAFASFAVYAVIILQVPSELQGSLPWKDRGTSGRCRRMRTERCARRHALRASLMHRSSSLR